MAVSLLRKRNFLPMDQGWTIHLQCSPMLMIGTEVEYQGEMHVHAHAACP